MVIAPVIEGGVTIPKLNSGRTEPGDNPQWVTSGDRAHGVTGSAFGQNAELNQAGFSVLFGSATGQELRLLN
jgi:hypothetical protein